MVVRAKKSKSAESAFHLGIKKGAMYMITSLGVSSENIKGTLHQIHKLKDADGLEGYVVEKYLEPHVSADSEPSSDDE